MLASNLFSIQNCKNQHLFKITSNKKYLLFLLYIVVGFVLLSLTFLIVIVIVVVSGADIDWDEKIVNKLKFYCLDSTK